MAQTMTIPGVPGWSAWSSQIPRMAQALPGRAGGTHSASPVAIRVPQATAARGQQSLSPAGPRSIHAQSPATIRGAGVGGTSHSAVVAGGRPMVPPSSAPAAQTTRNRPPPQDYVVQHGLYRRPHHSLPPSGGQPQVVTAGRQSLQPQPSRPQPQPQFQQPLQQRPPKPQPAASARPSTGAFAEPLANLPVHYNFGGSSASAQKRTRRRDHAEFSDDDELAPSRSFNQMKLSLLVRCICFIHQEILRRDKEELCEEAQGLRDLYNEERYHLSNCHTDLRGWRKSLGDTNPLEIAAFILGLFENGFFEVSELICCLIFLRRFREKTGLSLDALCWRPLFVAALLVTDKYLIDSSVKGSSMAEQSMFPVLTPSQVFSLELTFWKKLDYGCLWLNRQHFKAFCQELEFNVQDSLEVARFVKSHNYVKSDTFTWGESPGHEMLLDYSQQAEAKRWDKGGGSGAQLPFSRPSNGITGKPVQPWKPRQTVYAQSPPKDDQLQKDADALAIREGVSPRRKAEKGVPPAMYCNGSKPRASSHTFVGERHAPNPSGGSVLKHSGSPQPPAVAQSPPEGSLLQQSPRRPPHVSSGPCLFAGTAGNTAVLREVQYGREDPSLLSFAEKTHMFNARSQSQGDPSSRRPSRPMPQPTPAPAAVAPQGAPRPSITVGAGLNGYDPARGFSFAPNSRNTLPVTMKPCVQPPAPANIARSAAGTPQQLTPAGPNQAQIYGGVHARGRSTSPAYNGGAPGFIATTMRHPQPVIYRR